MYITTIGELRDNIKDLSDDFKIELRVNKEIPNDILKNMSYPYPYESTHYRGFEFDDVGYSDKIYCISVLLSQGEWGRSIDESWIS